jgi:hypothetical protein
MGKGKHRDLSTHVDTAVFFCVENEAGISVLQ